MRFDNFDLNLLVALDALLDEQSVTRAARRLNLTQSAMSAALARLREALKDDILVPNGRQMLATSHARSLAPAVSEALAGLRTLLSGATAFDPATSTREFTIAASDYVTTVLIAPMLARLKEEAPGIKLRLSLPSSASLSRLVDGHLDFIMTPEKFLSSDHPTKVLFCENHVVIGCKDNPVFRNKMTEEVFYSCGHISVEIVGTKTFIDAALADMGDRRRVEVIAPSFTLVPQMLPGTNLLALMHERLATSFIKMLPLAIAPVPFQVPVMEEMVQYHRARANDPGLMWLLQRFLNPVPSSN